MKRLLLTAVLLAALGAPARADVADGLGAYWRGHYVAALREFQPLARAGDAAAQFYLGEMYEDGRGVPQNDAEAAKWYRKSAEQGDATAQFNLGFIYGEGEGVPQDYVQAHMWSNLAAAQGNELARKNRDIDEKRMTPAQVADAQRLARAWRPKKAGPSIASRGGNSNITPAPRSGGFKALLPTPPNRSAPTTPSRELVARIQESLASLGYDPGSVDGIPGAKTRVAIRAFQADRGLPVTGTVSENLYSELIAAALLAARRAAGTPPKQRKLEKHATGSGFVVSRSGHVLTNQHVVEGCRRVCASAGTLVEGQQVIVAGGLGGLGVVPYGDGIGADLDLGKHDSDLHLFSPNQRSPWA